MYKTIIISIPVGFDDLRQNTFIFNYSESGHFLYLAEYREEYKDNKRQHKWRVSEHYNYTKRRESTIKNAEDIYIPKEVIEDAKSEFYSSLAFKLNVR